MEFQKGKAKTRGRKVGSSNKLTTAARQSFHHAFDVMGGKEALAAWAKLNPSEFYQIYRPHMLRGEFNYVVKMVFPKPSIRQRLYNIFLR